MLGLQLNHWKTELICAEPTGSEVLDATLDLCKVSCNDTMLLDSPKIIGSNSDPFNP